MNGRRAFATLAGVTVLAAVVALLVIGLPRAGVPPIGAAATPSATASPPTGVNPSRTPRAAPTMSPTVIPVTNPDGPQMGPDPIDSATFIEPARALSNFAGLWVDRNQRDFHIAVAGDVDAAIATLKPMIPIGMTVYFHAVSHTYAELESVVNRVIADRAELKTLGIAVNFANVAEKENVIELGIDPLTEDSVATMTERYGEGIEFEYSPSAPPYLNTPWPTIPEVLHAQYKQPGGEELLTCGEVAFPASALEGPGGAEEQEGPVYDGLRETLRVFGPNFGNTDGLSWRLVYQDETEAHFMAKQGDLWLDAQTALEDGRWYAAGMGQCRPIVASPEGVGPAEWALDPDYPAPTAISTELNILVWERSCSSGRPTTGRMPAPIVELTDDALVMTLGVEPLPGIQNCIGGPPTAVLVVLPEPMGERNLLDGGKSPPTPPAAPY